MSAPYATFGLAPAMRAGAVLADGDHQLHRDFVDFVVDGTPLLYRLADLDAVSPLAADVPPAIFTAQIRGLLLETEAPLPEGRYLVYGCPECADLACGAVTVVIEKDGDDFRWRDFAWQTGERVDLERDGYPGLGPFRFRGDAYREALGTLLERGAGPRRRVLLIGARAAVLGKLAAALRTIGIGADIAHDVSDVAADELHGYDAVAFGRGVDERERAAVRASFARAGADPAYVEGLAPITPLLVAQIQHALERRPAGPRRLTGLTATGTEALVEVAVTCRVRVTGYRLDRLSRTHTHEAFDGVLEPGRHRIALDPKAARGASFAVARTTGSVLVTTVTPDADAMDAGRSR
ncbi:hypothetical protein OK074_7713 [Actinobacteria bacterium OK074]|nr:hypothetical protein OK074_7713 [Actinobacteria bacterium OK074]